MVNRYRGEVALMVEGEALPMRLTLGALAELETAFSVDSLPALGERFAGGRLSARDVSRILTVGLRGAGGSFSETEVAAFAFDGGLNGAIAAAIRLLDATFGEPASESSETRPPLPSAS
jgi:hypothetical protein